MDGAAINDGDGDDVDDALLAAAQARLAHMTSERQEGAGADLQAADVFKEGGPDGLGEMGAEPACDLLLLELGGPAPRTLAHMPLAPHRVVTAHAGERALPASPPPLWGLRRCPTSTHRPKLTSHRIQKSALPLPQTTLPPPACVNMPD